MNTVQYAKKLCDGIRRSCTNDEITSIKYSYARYLQEALEKGRDLHAEHVPQYGLSLYKTKYLRNCVKEFKGNLENQKGISKADYYGLHLAILHMHASIVYQDAVSGSTMIRKWLGMPMLKQDKINESFGIENQISELFSFSESNDWMKVDVPPKPLEPLPRQQLGDKISYIELALIYKELYETEIEQHLENAPRMGRDGEMWTIFLKAVEDGYELRNFTSSFCTGIAVTKNGECFYHGVLMHFSPRRDNNAPHPAAQATTAQDGEYEIKAEAAKFIPVKIDSQTNSKTSSMRDAEDRTDDVDAAVNMYKQGDDCYDRHDYTNARKYYLLAAEQGCARSQNSLGEIYRLGRGISQDLIEAKKWYEKAAEQGHLYAHTNLAFLYSNGLGVRKNYKKAVELYKFSAEKGEDLAQFRLAEMYKNGHGIKKNLKQADFWFKKAEKQGRINGNDDD